jgi:hypothetical protein
MDFTRARKQIGYSITISFRIEWHIQNHKILLLYIDSNWEIDTTALQAISKKHDLMQAYYSMCKVFFWVFTVVS